MELRPLSGISQVIPVYHWVNLTCESQEADQRAQSKKKPLSRATERFWLSVESRKAKGCPKWSEQRMPNKCTIIRGTCQALK